MKYLITLLAISFSLSSLAVEEFPVEHFFKDPAMLGPQLSPDGQYLAALTPLNINKETLSRCKKKSRRKQKSGVIDICNLSRRNIVVFKLSDPDMNCQNGIIAKCSRIRVTQLRGQNVASFFWANNDRIIFTTGGDQLNGITGAIDSIGIYAVNKDGKEPMQLVKPEDALTNQKVIRTEVLNLLPFEPENILVARNDRKRYYLDVYKMNVYTGKFRRMLTPPGPVMGWGVDNDGVVRLAAMQDENSLSYETQIMYREGEKSEWTEIDRFEGLQNGWGLMGFTENNEKLYVTSNLGQDTYSVNLFDPQTGEMEDVFANEGTDVNYLGFTPTGEPVTIIYNDIDTKPQRHYINNKWKNLIEGFKQAFGVDYVGISSMSEYGEKMILSINSDINPGEYYLYDNNKNNIVYLGSTRPWIDPKTMSKMKPITYEARDGETIYAFLTIPIDSDGKDLPLIINPHGGPFGIQDQWRFNPETQFFANQGYAVMQINYRGSGGYGKRFEKIGYKRWGLEMQDDISDGVQWAIDQGIADSEHVCIYGASYGGYATMAGITLTPELYRCAVNYVGIWDLKMLYEQNGRWVERMDRWFKNHVIDPKEDIDQLEKTSPKFHIDKIKAPLFIVHGRRDYNVRIEQAETLMDALDKKDIPYEVLIKREEGHGFVLEENRIELYSRMKTFFNENLAKN
ncbi:MAG: S9 family peptidase [Gammaproteobacteria bacterium]|nr:S9 family peptidase [Gammaproteobacteria bacterium]